VTDIDEVELGKYLAHMAFIEIRFLAAGNPTGPDGPKTPAERLERIRLIADLARLAVATERDLYLWRRDREPAELAVAPCHVSPAVSSPVLT
jgi:hypothetical protein